MVWPVMWLWRSSSLRSGFPGVVSARLPTGGVPMVSWVLARLLFVGTVRRPLGRPLLLALHHQSQCFLPHSAADGLVVQPRSPLWKVHVFLVFFVKLSKDFLSVHCIPPQLYHFHVSCTTVILTLSNQAEIWCVAPHKQKLIPREISGHLDK